MARFDEVFRSEGLRIVPTPIKAPLANAFAERFVGTLRRECLDRILIFGRGDLESTLRVYVEHYNCHRLPGYSTWSLLLPRTHRRLLMTRRGECSGAMSSVD